MTIVLLLFALCSAAPPQSPREQVRTLIEEFEAALDAPKDLAQATRLEGLLARIEAYTRVEPEFLDEHLMVNARMLAWYRGVDVRPDVIIAHAMTLVNAERQVVPDARAASPRSPVGDPTRGPDPVARPVAGRTDDVERRRELRKKYAEDFVLAYLDLARALERAGRVPEALRWLDVGESRVFDLPDALPRIRAERARLRG
ncbi:MAG: hypothetical protein R2752_06535 [Vicinamibacterales bacterium]